MKIAYIFPPGCPPTHANIGKAVKASVDDVPVKMTYTDLKKVSDEERLRCCDCLEAVSLVRRDGKLNHFRHHRRCRFRTEALLKAQHEQLRQELEEACSLIGHMVEEAHEAEKVIHHIEERWAA